MANYKSFVFNATNDSEPIVTPTVGRHHLYVDTNGHIQVINHLGEVVPQPTTAVVAQPLVYRARIAGFDGQPGYQSNDFSPAIPLWERVVQGHFQLTIEGAFTANKTYPSIGLETIGDYVCTARIVDVDRCEFFVRQIGVGAFDPDIMWIRVEVAP